MKPTKAQQKAIEATDSDLLVSAGAGSGKTTVLSARLMNKIKNGAEITDFLVVTFTNASAADLRGKLSKKLYELCKDNPEDKRYQRQLYALPMADIGTIDSFCLQYVKQYATVLGLGGTTVGDGALCDALLESCADRVLDALCENDALYIDLLLDNFANHKSDSGLINAVVKVYKKIRAYPFYRDWLDELAESYRRETEAFSAEGFFDLPHGKTVKDCIEELALPMEAAAESLLSLAENEKQYAFAETIYALVKELCQAVCRDYAAFSAVMGKAPRFRRPRDCGEEFVGVYSDITGRLKKLLSFAKDEEELRAEYEMSLSVIRALRSFLLELDTAYSEEKKRRGIIDFADGEQYFLQLLVTKTDKGLLKTSFCRSLSAAYKEVYIDEYQDVSPLQDTIFSLIGQGKRFMVGDVKQSIYGFRNAYPDLFISYCEAFSEEAGGTGQKVFLKENFRCDRSIVDFCNHVFGKVYTKATAGSDYSAEALVHGKNDTESQAVTVRIYENAEKDSKAEINDTVREIIKLISEGTAPSEIAVLCRKNAPLRLYADALAAHGVPTSLAVGKEALLQQPEVLLATSALRVIDNPTDDISLAALLRSPLFRFTADELYDIRRGGISLYDDLRRTAYGKRERNKSYKLVAARLPRKKLLSRPVLNKGVRDELSSKCAAFMEKLMLYRSKALFLPVDKLLWYFYEDTDIMAYAPEDRRDKYKANLLAFYRLAMGMENNSYKGVSVFTEYLTRLAESESSPDAEKDVNEGVKLMNVHSSKGLEFPVVFVVGCGGKIRKNDTDAGIGVEYKSGISFKLNRQASALSIDPLLRRAELKEGEKRAVAEELRILYVAFTRAEKRLYVSAGFGGTLAERIENKKTELLADLFLSAVAKGKEMFYNISVTDASDREEAHIAPLWAAEREWEELPLPEIHPMPQRAQGVAAKLSASVLERNREGILVPRTEALVTDREPSFIKDVVSAARRGTANHLFMQFADFLAAEVDAVAEADRLLALGFVSAEERRLMDTAAIGRFFSSALYGEIKASARVYREKRFTTRIDGALLGAERETPLLQGVIDCFFLNAEGGYTLVDYKTDSVRPGQEAVLADRHGVQLGLYRLYIEKVTGKPVTKAYIYSFALDKAIDCGDPAKL